MRLSNILKKGRLICLLCSILLSFVLYSESYGEPSRDVDMTREGMDGDMDRDGIHLEEMRHEGIANESHDDQDGEINGRDERIREEIEDGDRQGLHGDDFGHEHDEEEDHSGRDDGSSNGGSPGDSQGVGGHEGEDSNPGGDHGDGNDTQDN